MILDNTTLVSAVLDGEEETTPQEGSETPTNLLDGEEEGGAETPAQEGGSEETPSEPSEGGDAQ